MESDIIELQGYQIKYISLNTLITGSGAAALNAAISLHSLGVKDIMIATAGWGAGTSNNAGSDKQTYYKLSLAGGEQDSVRVMAEDLFNGHCMHGDIALCEAQGSVRAFMNLVSLGVPFPHDKYGAWAGYKTDHDPRARATSAGPHTSGIMFRKLAAEVGKRKIEVLDHHHIVALLTGNDKSQVRGALALNTSEKNPKKAFVLFNATNIILGTGGPGNIYESSVYPLSQTGSTGMAFKAGAVGQNLSETQFGIASVKFRWNLSGSYQQVIPRYFSTDKEGRDETEFLNGYFPDYQSLTRAIFLKGYQWPFDAEKIAGCGSSLIDILVYLEREEKGRKVYIDFTRNVSWEGNDIFHSGDLNFIVRDYLERSGALQGTPAGRLEAMNSPALALYREQGIDLKTEPLEIAVCAQHNNGGLKANIWWESNLKHLFPVGEVNGSHGVKRPGGAALNSGQVGSFRAAQYIASRYKSPPMERDRFLAMTENETGRELDQATRWLSSTGEKNINNKVISEIRKRMSKSGGIIRNGAKASRAAEEAFTLVENLPDRIGASSVKELKECFMLVDNCLTHFVYLEAIKAYIENGGRSRGSFIVTVTDDYAGIDVSQDTEWINLCRYDRDIEKNILEISFCSNNSCKKIVRVREIPDQNLWFEKVWKDYLEDNLFKC